MTDADCNELDDRDLRRREAERLPALEAANPQPRPVKKRSLWDKVDFMAWDNEADLGVQSFRHQRTLGYTRSF